VAKARYSDPAATEYITRTLIARRDKVLTEWLTAINPVVDATLSPDGVLTFRNAAIDAGVVRGPASYDLTWLDFDNATGTTTPVGEPIHSTEPRADISNRLTGSQEFVAVAIRTRHADHAVWQKPVTVYFRRAGAGWRTVGLDRAMP
jgi:hypothetical protein